MTRRIIDITAADFAAVIAEWKCMTLVDFWSPDCAPCRTLAPILDDLAADFTDAVQICKADVTGAPALTERTAVAALPTLVLYRDGAEVDRVVGLRSRAQLNDWIEHHL